VLHSICIPPKAIRLLCAARPISTIAPLEKPCCRWCGLGADGKAAAVELEEHIRPHEAGRGWQFKTSLALYKAGRARDYNRLKDLFMAAEALVQASLNDLARKAALKGSGWMGPS